MLKDITNLIHNTYGFNASDFTNHKYREALEAAGYHENDKGWFSKIGKFISEDADIACSKLNVSYESVEAKVFYLVSDKVAWNLIDQNEKVIKIHDVWIWGLVDGGVTTDEVEELIKRLG